MADAGPSLDEVRQRLIELIEEEEWRITERAERTGRESLRRSLPVPTQVSIVLHVLKLLKQDDCSLVPVPMGEPPGSHGVGYTVRDPVSPNLYIKVKIEEDLAWIISFHESIHMWGAVDVRIDEQRPGAALSGLRTRHLEGTSDQRGVRVR
jgi:hypothetical protein